MTFTKTFISQESLDLILKECEIANSKIESVNCSYDLIEIENVLESVQSCIYEIKAAINTKGDDNL
jgi:hypothetical protein